jgi:hypothetical protein
MKKIILFFFLVIGFGAYSQTLSDQARFGLVTVSPGSTNDAIYQIWGHTVLHLYDPVNQINECYDYGTFSFNQPGFVIKFLRGTLPYQMAKYDFGPFVDFYRIKENRSSSEQILNLTQNQKQSLYEYLLNNYLPENREYRYRFFYYNCSSRIRDILQNICGDSLVFSQTLHADSTYRQWIDRYADKKMPWTNFGMNIAIGMPSDEKTKESGAMFLPDNLAAGFDSAQIIINGTKQPFVIQKIQHSIVDPPALSKSKFSPLVVFTLFLIFTILFTWWQIRKNQINYLFDNIYFSVLGLAGWFLVFLWFFTDHGVTSNNLNVMWAFPFLFPFFFTAKNSIPFKILAYSFLIINILMLVFFKLLPQELPLAVIPLSLASIIRIIYILKSIHGLPFNILRS